MEKGVFEKIKYRLLIIRWELWVNIIAASPLLPPQVRFLFYKIAGIKLSTNDIRPRCYMGGNRISIGNGTFINCYCHFDNSSHIVIGENCSIAMEVMFVTSTHELGGPKQRAGKSIGKPIRIENGCWIGARSTILPGVTIREGCMIAAGSFIVKDCESNGLYAGVPAKRIKELALY
jgi:maltose O-acetyltransferase